eukprot:CAMPEP_0172467754 /NCGR_PEP_ID=MMETSP1065-20121228/59728_1 /TAXON_ID=265537 /ORGANISM="Amphiprora paludosa, Strain CCMP125" /LENGTH=50 /DNA_ID=CAMNT_0013224987 /DNA_START=88 /DNA_END=236 /DNA_ORIENTATION=-
MASPSRTTLATRAILVPGDEVDEESSAVVVITRQAKVKDPSSSKTRVRVS